MGFLTSGFCAGPRVLAGVMCFCAFASSPCQGVPMGSPSPTAPGPLASRHRRTKPSQVSPSPSRERLALPALVLNDGLNNCRIIWQRRSSFKRPPRSGEEKPTPADPLLTPSRPRPDRDPGPGPGPGPMRLPARNSSLACVCVCNTLTGRHLRLSRAPDGLYRFRRCQRAAAGAALPLDRHMDPQFL